jgi:putative phage-type endonuclease
MTENLQQGAKEWRDARLGKVTASRIADILAKPLKGRKESSARRNYRAELVSQILTGKQREEFQSWEMKRGIELEPLARTEYEIQKGVMVDTVGFVPHPRIVRAGASPDGLVGDDGLVQFKCPKTATHIDWRIAGIVPTEHRAQMQFEMACTGRQWNDFVSYTDELPDDLCLFVIRLNRDDVAIKESELAVEELLSEVDAMIADLRKPPLEQQLRDSLELAKK